MKNKIYIVLNLTFLILLAQLEAFSQITSELCPISRNVGSKEICLPILSNMTECIMDGNVMNYLNSRTIKGNRNIALYIDDIHKSSIKNLEKELLTNYLIVYTTNELEEDQINDNFIMLIDSSITSNYKSFLDKNWNNIKQRIEEKVKNLKLDQPVLIDHYFVEKNVPCIVTINRSNEQYFERIILTATVFRELKGKFVAYAWYVNYEDEQSLMKLKANVDYFSFVMSQLNLTNSDLINESKNKVDPNLVKAITYFNTAYKRSSEGKYEDAINLYTKAIEMYPKTERIKISEAYFNRGINKRYLNNLLGAISDYSEAIKIRPGYSKAYHNR
jgi:tetratricopeptide (TPR) repeat protein